MYKHNQKQRKVALHYVKLTNPLTLTAPSHYLKQCWNILNWTLGNKLQWNLNRNLNIFIQENAFENVVWKMATILSRPQCVNFYHFYTSDVFYTDVYYFTFVVPKMYQWQVRNDFNKDVYIYIYILCNFKLDFKKVDQVKGCKWLIQGKNTARTITYNAWNIPCRIT